MIDGSKPSHLVREILDHIFSYLKPLSRAMVGQVNRHWRKIAEKPTSWWREVADQHIQFLMLEFFPEHVRQNPKSIFLTAFHRNIMRKGDVIQRHAALGHAQVVETFLNAPGPQLLAEEKGVALIKAAGHCNSNVVSVLLTHGGDEISLEHKRDALEAATRGDEYWLYPQESLQCAITVLTLLEKDLSREDKKNALIEAAASSVVPNALVEALLPHYPLPDIVAALKAAVESRCVEKVDVLLNQRGRDLSAQEQVDALGVNGARLFRLYKRTHPVGEPAPELGREIINASKRPRRT